MPDIGHTHRVTFSMRFSVIQRSVRHVASNVACKSYLRKSCENIIIFVEINFTEIAKSSENRYQWHDYAMIAVVKYLLTHKQVSIQSLVDYHVEIWSQRVPFPMANEVASMLVQPFRWECDWRKQAMKQLYVMLSYSPCRFHNWIAKTMKIRIKMNNEA